MARQLRLSLRRPPSYAPDAFAAGASNTQARAAIGAWPKWPGGCLALIGPPGVGKTHLARSWAQSSSAVVLDRAALDPTLAVGRPALVEDVDRGVDPEPLFHLLNQAAREDHGLLLTARTRPAAWPAALPDLRSRLNALWVAEIDEPDDDVLQAVLKTLFSERSIRPHDDVYPYLLKRMERSVAGARKIVELLDETEHADIRPVSRVLARQILEGDNQNLDLFEG